MTEIWLKEAGSIVDMDEYSFCFHQENTIHISGNGIRPVNPVVNGKKARTVVVGKRTLIEAEFDWNEARENKKINISDPKGMGIVSFKLARKKDN